VDNVLTERVRDIVADTFGLGLQEVTDEASAQNLAAWSSLAHLRLVANLEQAFGVRFTLAEMTAMQSVQTIDHVLTCRGVTTRSG
jgi:acyl carrier protein